MTRAAYLPDITGKTRQEAAHLYADAGIAVFPVNGKEPVRVDRMDGRGQVPIKWSEWSTTDHRRIEQWSKAYWNPAGEHYEYRKGIGVDLGKSGLCVPDVDRSQLVPDDWWSALADVPFESTDSHDPLRGHYFFQQPDKLIGNPRESWGEVKGMGGYVIVAPSPHACTDMDWPNGQTPEKKYRPTARYQQMRSGLLVPLPEEIASSFGEYRQARAAVSTQVAREFLDRFTSDEASADPGLLHAIVRTFLKNVEKNQGRHPSMCSALGWAAQASAAKLITAQTAYDTLDSVFTQVKGAEIAPGEFEDMWAWAVGQVTEESVQTFRLKWAEKRQNYIEEREERRRQQREAEREERQRAVVDAVETAQEAAREGVPEVEQPELEGPGGEEAGAAQEAETAPGQIPEAFWTSRDVLAHIRTAAHSRCASGDVALYGVLTRLSAMIDHRIVADVGQGFASLNLFTGIVDNSGGGKSDGIEVSHDLLMAPPDHRDFLDGVGLSTGEGIAESFLGQVGTGEFWEKGPHKGEEKTARGQVRHNAFFETDEGGQLISLGNKPSSILWPTIRSAWQSKTLSQQNATEERRRYVGRNTYAMGIVAAFQEPNALDVIRDDITGTAQRFMWCRGSDPTVPRRRSQAPAHPGPLSVFPQMMSLSEGEWRVITFPDDICDLIWEEKAARKAGELIIDKLDSHANLMKMKLAALLALLNPELNPVRPQVTHEDFKLAEMLWAASCELRDDLIRRAEIAARAEAAQRREEKVVTETAVHVSKSDVDTKVRSVARWMYNTVRDGKAGQWSELCKRAPGRNSKYLKRAFSYAESVGWLIFTDEETGSIATGDSKPV